MDGEDDEREDNEADDEGANVEEDQEVVGFLDNGVCFPFFSMKLYQLIFLLRCRCLMLKIEKPQPGLPTLLSLKVRILVLLPLPRLSSFPIKLQKGNSPHALIDWQLLQNLI